MNYYPTQLDEIDQWLADNFGILPGACASTENLRHNTARMIAEALWPNKDYIADDSKKVSGDSIKSNGLDEAAEKYANTYYGEFVGIEYEFGDPVEIITDDKPFVRDAFKAGANWQREQDLDACYQCEKDYDNVFYRGEKHAIKMLKEEGIGGTVCGRVIDHINIRFADGVGKYLEPKDISHIPADKSKYNIGDKVKVIILKDE